MTLTLLTSESAFLTVGASSLTFDLDMQGRRLYAYCCTVDSWIKQSAPLPFDDLLFAAEADSEELTALEPLEVADFVFTADNTTETLTKVAHGLVTGDGPVQVSNSGGALPTGLLAATDYWVIRINDDDFQLALSLTEALASTEVTFSTDGTGVQTLSDTASTTRIIAHGFLTGAGPVRLSNSGGALPTGLTADTDYWIIRTDADTFQLASTFANAMAGTEVTFTTDGTGTQTLSSSEDSESDSVATAAAGSAFVPAKVFVYLDGGRGTHLGAVRDSGSGSASLTPVASGRIG